MTESTIPLGKATLYPASYDPTLLFAVERKGQREAIGIESSLPFNGDDRWTAYEVSWLNSKGKPMVAIAIITFDCTSLNIVESKSLKLYLNSLNQHRFDSGQTVKSCIESDLSQCAKGNVSVELYGLDEFSSRGITELPGQCIDEQDIECEAFQYSSSLLKCSSNQPVVKELYSHLLKSNCLITSQPDWATLVIRYTGNEICEESLLQYIVSFRNHNEFHEHCVERIFQDITKECRPEKLTVLALYTRRGGLDINPWRSNYETNISFLRTSRQ